MRTRVIWVKALASICHARHRRRGRARGADDADRRRARLARRPRCCASSARERRILLVAGVAAGISAVFRTPLGAALLAVEVLYRDDFESDALVPARPRERRLVLGRHLDLRRDARCSRTPPRYPFVPAHLPLYALLALLVVAARARSSWRRCARVQRVRSARCRCRAGLGPALGGLAARRCSCAPIVLGRRRQHSARPGQGLGILGGGYGAAQVAITGSLAARRTGARVQLLLVALRWPRSWRRRSPSAPAAAPATSRRRWRSAASFGGAFGRAAQLLLARSAHRSGRLRAGRHGHVLRRHRARAAERAGAGLRAGRQLRPARAADARAGIAFVALRKRSLYHAQVPTQRDSPAHRTRRSTSCADVRGRGDAHGVGERRADRGAQPERAL